MFNSKKIAKINRRLDNTVNKNLVFYIADVLGIGSDINHDKNEFKTTKTGRNALQEITAIQSECQKGLNSQGKMIGIIVNKLGELTFLSKKVALLEDLLGVQWATQEAQPAKSGYVKVATPKIPKNKKK